jgi:hypothetical protein
MSAPSAHLPHGAHFDDTVARRRATRGPRECGVQIGHVDEHVAAALFAIRTVLAFAVGVRRFEPR